MAVSIFGGLGKIPGFDSLPYSTQGAILRAVKAAGSALVGVLLAAAVAGTLLPVGTAPIIIMATTAGLQFADKWFREWKIEQEAKDVLENNALNDCVDCPEDNEANAEVKPEVNTEAEVNTDATVVTDTTEDK